MNWLVISWTQCSFYFSSIQNSHEAEFSLTKQTMKREKSFSYYFQNTAGSIADETCEVGMFLPPCWHVLLRMKPQNNTIVASIGTDNIKLLTLVSEYLHQLQDLS